VERCILWLVFVSFEIRAFGFMFDDDDVGTPASASLRYLTGKCSLLLIDV
jgi:hypothetical protein